MRYVLCLVLAALLLAAPLSARENRLVTVPDQPAGLAWWLRAEFHPFESKVRGIPVNRIRRDWCRASEFRKELFPPQLAGDLDAADGFDFAVHGSFDGQGSRQTALVGVYETCRGQRGSFLLVLDEQTRGLPVVRFVDVERSTHQFAMVAVFSDSTIVVVHCLECDVGAAFTFDRSKRRFVRVPASVSAD